MSNVDRQSRLFVFSRAARIGVAVASGIALVAVLPTSPAQAMAANVVSSAGATCGAGQQATGGGAAVVGEGAGDFRTQLLGGAPQSHPNIFPPHTIYAEWWTGVRNGDSVSHHIGLYSVCVDSPAGYQIVSRSVTVAAGGLVRDVASCPPGSVALGGGVEALPYSPDQPVSRDNVLQESSPGIADGVAVWMTSLHNNDSVAHSVKLVAVCGASPAGYQIVHKDLTVAAGAFVRNSALCPAGTVVLSGGVAVVGSGVGDFKTRIQESAPGTAGGQPLWLTALRNADTVAHTISIYAVCATPLPGYQVVRADV